MKEGNGSGLTRAPTPVSETLGLGRTASLAVSLLAGAIVLFAVFWFFHSAPPDTLIITSGPEGSFFRTNAEKYAQILARNGVKLKILPSQGSLENLTRLADPAFHVDIGFVQGGMASGQNISGLVSLGSISYEPLLLFYRNAQTMKLLSEFTGRRLAIGTEGSGTRSTALALLAANDIVPGGPTILEDLDAEDAAKALTGGKVDAVFLMGDFASPQLMRSLLLTPSVRLFDFAAQADAYTRRITYLDKLDLPEGSIDFGRDIPSHDISLIGPTVEIIARKDLHPALSDLLLDAAIEVNGKAGLLKKRGEFPAPLEHEFPISSDASRFYKSGKSFLYRSLPFWVASLVNRILVAFVPMIVVLIPVLRFIPRIYQWRVRLRIFRWYRVLLAIEKDLVSQPGPEKREELLGRLHRVEDDVNKMKLPASFADQFYVLRGNIRFVRDSVTEDSSSSAK
jgi:hypothetical protein